MAVAVAGFGLVFSGSIALADEGFLRLEAITISASDTNHDGWINLLAFADGSVLGPLAAASAGGATATPPKISQMTIFKKVDATSPKLMLYCATGKHLPRAQVDFVRAGGGPVYAVIEMEDVLISGYSFGGSGQDAPTESVSLNFTKISVSVVDRNMTHLWQTTFDVRSGRIGFSETPLISVEPTIEPVATQLTDGTMHTFSVRVGDPDTPLGNLSLTGSSDNPNLLPAGAFSFVGSGSVRQVTLTPTAGATGLAQASITVSDGAASATAYFLVVVSPNDGTNILLAPNNVPEHTPAGITVGLLEAVPSSPAGPPMFELLDSAAGRFRVEGNALVVNDPFLLDFETAPQPVIVVQARDAFGNASRAVAITVNVDDVPEGPFDSWRHTHFTPAELLQPSLSGPYGNADGDPYNNFFEYAMGLPPKDGNNGAAVPSVGEMDVGGVTYLTFTFRRVKSTVDPDLIVEPETSGDFFHWNCGPAWFVPVSVTSPSADIEEVTVRSVLPLDQLVKQFVRVRILR